MKTKEAQRLINEAYQDGYREALLTSRYYALRYKHDDQLFDASAPTHAPDVVCEILDNTCRDCLDKNLFGTAWSSMDDLLICNTPEEVSEKQESTGNLMVH